MTDHSTEQTRFEFAWISHFRVFRVFCGKTLLLRLCTLNWRQRLPNCLFVFCLLFIAISSADAATTNSEFEAAKKTFLSNMRRSGPYDRATAVKLLAKVVQPGTAELLIKRGVTDEDLNVRKTARKALRQLAVDTHVNQYLFGELEKSIRKTTGFDVSCEYFRALTITADEDQQNQFLKWLDEYLAAPKANLLIPITVIDDLGLQGDVDAVQSVKFLAKAKIFESHFGYRRCIVQAMSQIRQIEAVDYLIELLPKTEGLIQYDVIQYLTRLTKKRFRQKHEKWAAWWEENRESFQFPDPDEELPDEEVIDDEEDNERVRYYGIPICAKRVVFVLDTSLSMHGQPIEAAKMALLKAVQSLPEVVQFDIVLFDSQATTWRPQLSPATPEAKRAAEHLVTTRELGGGTASSTALKAAFKLEPEAIYFISDGKPTDFQPDMIVNAVTQLNRIHRISIHSVGLVTGNRGGGELRSFMYPLANRNWGTFRLIE